MAFSMEALISSSKLTLGISNQNFSSLFHPPLKSNSNSNSNSFPKISQNFHSLTLIPYFSQSNSGYSINNQNTLDFEANSGSESPNRSTLLFPDGFKRWVVNVDEPPTGFASKAQAVDFYVNILIKVVGNERDAQMCLCHVHSNSKIGFECMLDEESAQELSAVPGVLSVHPDEQFQSESKDYGGSKLLSNPPEQVAEISKTKLFITGLSFYTSEKTLRSAFEPFGELVEVKVIMDKISKRSKGFAFVEYTTEEEATTALEDMNGKIINGWMIVVDRAKSKPKYSRDRLKSSLRDRKLV